MPIKAEADGPALEAATCALLSYYLRPPERIHDCGPRRLALELIVQRQDTHRQAILAWGLPRQPRPPITQSPEDDRIHRWMRQNRRQEGMVLLSHTGVAKRKV